MNELITLAELAKIEHISEDAARKRASRGWYDKVKVNGKTLYRRPGIETEPEPPKPANTIQGAIAAVLKDYTEPDSEDEERPKDEPFPGAWNIADTFGTPWEDLEYYGELFGNDPDAVALYCFVSRMVQDATILHLRVASRPGSKVFQGTNTLTGVMEGTLSGVEIQAESITERLIAAWIEDGKPTLTAEYLTEKIKAGITDPAKVEESYFHD